MLKVVSNHRKAEMKQLGCVRGFTLIELLVAISILAVLISVGFVGFGKVLERGRVSATRQTMENLKGLVREAEANGLYRESRQPIGMWESDRQWRIRTDLGTGGIAPDFWRKPNVHTDPKTLVAPNVPMHDGNLVQWRDSSALRTAAMANAILMADSGIAKSFGSFPEKTRRLASFYNSTKSYSQGERVLYAANPDTSSSAAPPGGNGFMVYVARGPVNAGSTPATATENANWSPDYAGVMDDWGHVILMVPSSGLQVGSKHDSNLTYDIGDRVYIESLPNRTYYVCKLKGNASPPNTTYWTPATAIQAPDGKPFFASAGADGDFSKENDNLYSFEN